jgi:endonuclease/exonuclease/phosphatase family metal-dependent hydrolase
MKTPATPALKFDPFNLVRNKLPLPLLSVAAAMAMVLPVTAAPGNKKGDRDVDVMTVNLYVGGDIAKVTEVNPADPAALIGAVTEVFYDIVASNPPARIQTLAGQIAMRRPDMVALQEVSLIRVQSPGDLVVGGDAPATVVLYDYVDLLVAALAAEGARYHVVATANEADVELPMYNFSTGTVDDVRLTDREVILVRSDLPPGHLRVTNPQSGNFEYVIEIPGLGALERGWCSVDVAVRGRDFRFICTHLEVETWPFLQELQVQELLAGPANTTLPVVLVGDFNTDALGRDGSTAYPLIPEAGFSDAWAVLNPQNPAGGLTWGHDEYLADYETEFDRRIDFVFYQGKGLSPVRSSVVDLSTGLAPSPLWATDHAALTATIRFK